MFIFLFCFVVLGTEFWVLYLELHLLPFFLFLESFYSWLLGLLAFAITPSRKTDNRFFRPEQLILFLDLGKGFQTLVLLQPPDKLIKNLDF